VSSITVGQIVRNNVQEKLLKLEKEFTQAILKNDAEAIGQFLADDWIIIGGIIDKSRFQDVIRSGGLTHQLMESDDVRVRVYGDSSVVTALTATKGRFMGQDFSTRERATDV